MNKATILLVEDEVSLREILRDILVIDEYVVHTASNGEQALSMLAEITPDIIICDIKMPKMDGYQFLTAARKNVNFQETPFIFLSAKVEQEDVRSGMNLGADDYLLKPVKRDVLIGAIEARLNRSQQIRSLKERQAVQKFESTYSYSAEQIRVKIGTLSKSESKILKLISEGNTSGEIAAKLFISPKTVENHRYNIARKLDVSGSHSVLSFALVAKPFLD